MKLKKWVKVSGIILGGIIVVSIIGNAVSGGSNTNTVRTSQPATQQEQPKKQEQQPVEKISQENFDKIKTGDAITGDGGMSEADVIALLGQPDNNVTTTSTINGKSYKMDSMTWAAGLQMKSITVTFINGFASSKGMMK